MNETTTETTVEKDPPLLSALILLAMAAAMAWSWDHLAHLADMSGAARGELGAGDLSVPMAWLLPVSVDVLLIAGAWKARRLHTLQRRPGAMTMTALIGAGLMSLGGNVLSTLDLAAITPPMEEWSTAPAVAVVVIVGLWMPSAAILGLEVLRDRGAPLPAPVVEGVAPMAVLSEPAQVPSDAPPATPVTGNGSADPVAAHRAEWGVPEDIDSWRKVDALGLAFDRLGTVDARAAVVWLNQAGIEVSPTHAQQVARRVRQAAEDITEEVPAVEVDEVDEVAPAEDRPALPVAA